MPPWRGRPPAMCLAGPRLVDFSAPRQARVQSLPCDQFQKLRVRLRLRESRNHRLGRFLDLLLHQGPTEEMDPLERLRVDQELLLSRPTRRDVDRGPEA